MENRGFEPLTSAVRWYSSIALELLLVKDFRTVVKKLLSNFYPNLAGIAYFIIPLWLAIALPSLLLIAFGVVA